MPPPVKSPRPNRRSARSSPVLGALVNATLLLVVLGTAWIGPRVLDALSAREWAWYHARLGVRGFRAADEARLAGAEAARALDRGAPLPLAADGAQAVVVLTRELLASDPRAALAACGPALEVLTRLESTGWRAAGLHGLAAELRELDARARKQLAARAAAP
jgi:hypothetical protein